MEHESYDRSCAAIKWPFWLLAAGAFGYFAWHVVRALWLGTLP